MLYNLSPVVHQYNWDLYRVPLRRVGNHYTLYVADGFTREFDENTLPDEIKSKMELISVLMENGLKVPGDISVIGFDDDPVCLYGPVALTTIRQPLKEMAQSAVKELYLRMQDPNRTANRIVLPTELIIRDSTRPFHIS